MQIKRLLLFVCAVAINFSLCAQINQYGVPFVRTFPKIEYGADMQNWGIVQDQRGLMYFANQTAVLEYDGNSWKSYPIRNNAFLMSMAIDSSNVLRIGASGEFGYMTPNENGDLSYVSISASLPDTIQCGDIYKTYCNGSKTYYCSFGYVFVVEEDSIVDKITLPESSFFSYLVGDSIIISSQFDTSDLLVYYNGEFSQFKSNVRGSVYGIQPYSENTHLVTNREGLFEVGFKNKYFEHIENTFTEALWHKYEGVVYGMSQFDNDYVLSCLFSDKYGVVVLDRDKKPQVVLNKQLGLNDNYSITSLQTGNLLWVGLNDGISRVELGSALRMFGAPTGLSGAVSDVIEYNGDFYVATWNGLYYKTFDEDEFTIFAPIYNNTVYSLAELNIPGSKRVELVASSPFGAFYVKNKKVYDKVKDQVVEGDVRKLFQSQKDYNYLYAYTGADGLIRLKYNSLTRKFEKDTPESFEIIESPIVSIEEDDKGNIWFSSINQGIYKWDIALDSLIEYGIDNGLPSLFQVEIKNIDGTLYFGTPAGLYEFNANTETFVLSNLIGSVGQDSTLGIWMLEPYKEGYVVASYDAARPDYIKDIYFVNNDSAHTINPMSAVFERLPDEWMDVMFIDKDGNLWFSMSANLYCYKPTYINDSIPYYKAPFNAHIRMVQVHDSAIFNGAYQKTNGLGAALSQGEEFIVELPYRDNSLTFTYSATFFEEEGKLEYSTILEGVDGSWSKWNKRTEDVRYNLSEGYYTFKVKARNIYGVESTVAEYSFEICPPFYRTIVAYILYVIFGVFFIYGLIKWNTRRLIEEKKKLEQKIAEATEEIRGQNVQLEQQKDEIEKQKDEIQASINYARRIQRALLTPDETINRVFPDHFLLYKPRNVVSGDYYWVGQFGDNKVCIVADCTGHGVPGGFMSMLGMTNLNYIVGQELTPNGILNKLRNAIITSLRQKGDDVNSELQLVENKSVDVPNQKKDRSQDGMDVALYVINEKEMTLSFAGANNPLVLIRDGEAQVIKANKMPVGIYAKLDPFDRVDMELKKGDCLYTFSDGFQDQFGKETGRKFMSKRLRELLLEIHQKPMAEQKEILETTYEAWRGPEENQTDDVVLMGVRI